MLTTADLLNQYAKKHGLKTPYAIAKKIGISTPTIYRVVNEGKTLDNSTIVKMADDLGIEWQKAVAAIEAERAKSDDEKQFWMRHAGFADTALLAIIAAGSSIALFPKVMGAIILAANVAYYGNNENDRDYLIA